MPPNPSNRTGQLCTFPSRSDCKCGFTLLGKLLWTERRTSEEEVEKEKERWEMRVVRAQGVLEKWGDFKWKRSGLADTMAPLNTLNQSRTESPRQGQYLAQPYSHFTSTSLTLIESFLSRLIYFRSPPPPRPLLSLSLVKPAEQHTNPVFLPRCHLCQLFKVLAEPSCNTQEKVFQEAFWGEKKNHSVKSHLDLSLPTASKPLAKHLITDSLDKPLNTMQTLCMSSGPCKLLNWYHYNKNSGLKTYPSRLASRKNKKTQRKSLAHKSSAGSG